MADIEHKDIGDAQLHEPKGVASAVVGAVYTADGLGSGSWGVPVTATEIGWLNYNDLGTTSSPIAVTGGVPAQMTNDTLGAQTQRTYSPTGVTDFWDESTNQLDFSMLQMGDMIDLRVDLDITTSVANQEYEVVLRLGIGVFPFDLTLVRESAKSAGLNRVVRYDGLFIGSDLVKDNPGQIMVSSASDVTVVVNGWYIKGIINR